MKETLSQYGVAVVIIILVLREVLPWASGLLKSTNGQTRNGKTLSCVTRTEFDKHKEAVQYKDNCEQIQKTIEVKFNGLTTLTNQRFNTLEQGITDVKTLIRNRGGDQWAT